MSSSDSPDNQLLAFLKSPAGRICLGLAGAVLLVYGQVATHAFMSFDDPAYVLANPHVNRGLSFESLRWAFTDFHSQNWHPLTWISHMLDVSLFGLNAGAHLLVNVAIHAGGSILLFLALRAMTGALWPSAIVAALFALHPLRAESVAWVSERKDVLGGFFFMATLLAYARYTLAPSAARYAAVCGSLALGLMSKPMLVTLPMLLLLLDYWPLGRASVAGAGRAEDPARRELPAQTWSYLLLEKLPLLALVAISCVITLSAQQSVVSEVSDLPMPMRVANALISYVAYLWSALWPMKLAFFYPHPAVQSLLVEGEVLRSALLAAFTLSAITLAALVGLGRRPYLAVGWFWYIGMLVPVIGLVQVGVQARADRYTYLPLIGVAIAIVWGLRELAVARKVKGPMLRVPVLAILLLYAGLCAVQVATWKTPGTVALHAVRVTSGNYVAHNELGVALEAVGRTDEARKQYQQSLEANPNFTLANINLGNLHLKSGDAVLAEAQQRAAVEANPEEPQAYSNLAVALYEQGRSDEALTVLERALELDAGDATAQYNYALMLERQSQFLRAVEGYRKAIEIRPDYVDARINLGILLGRGGDLTGATEQLRSALESDPRHARALYNYAVALVAQGDLAGAATQLGRVLEVEPGNESARVALDELRAQLQ